MYVKSFNNYSLHTVEEKSSQTLPSLNVLVFLQDLSPKATNRPNGTKPCYNRKCETIISVITMKNVSHHPPQQIPGDSKDCEDTTFFKTQQTSAVMKNKSYPISACILECDFIISALVENVYMKSCHHHQNYLNPLWGKPQFSTQYFHLCFSSNVQGEMDFHR